MLAAAHGYLAHEYPYSYGRGGKKKIGDTAAQGIALSWTERLLLVAERFSMPPREVERLPCNEFVRYLDYAIKTTQNP